MNRNFKIKWGRENFTVEGNEENSVEQLKATIFTLKNIEVERQKLLHKGKVLDNKFSLSNLADGSTITLLGSASSESRITQTEKVVFVEDLTDEEKAKIMREKGEQLVYGLANLGNTCYFNSTVQCLGRVPELRNKLKEKSKTQGFSNDINEMFARNLGKTYDSLDNAHDTVVPSQLVQTLRTLYPLFNETDRGHHKQQDAEECWTLVMNSLKASTANPNSLDKYSSSAIDEYFGIEMCQTLKNIEMDSEIKEKSEIIYKLPCYIDGQTNELMQGLKEGLKENVELNSDLLGRNAVWEKSQLINRLPPYMCVQFVRFFWKKDNENTGAKGGKAKILKSVIFSKILDFYDFCTDSTKELLNLGRGIEAKLMKENQDFKADDLNNFKDMKSEDMVPTGRYRLISVLTHQGRSSESGHYIGWAHKNGEKWTKFDDDTITTVNEQSILELKGGGDWHMSYLCVYKRVDVPFQEIK